MLGRKLKQSGAQNGGRGTAISAQEHVEFAQRVGLDAILCDFPEQSQDNSLADGACQYNDGSIRTWADLDRLEQPIAIADQLNNLERYLRAADGTQIGVFASFTSFFDCAMRAAGLSSHSELLDNRFFFERLMDILLDRQQRVMRSVCDRFANELSFVMVRDEIASMVDARFPPDILQELYAQRMHRLIAPAKQYGLPVAIHSRGDTGRLLPLLHDIGFDIIHSASADANDLRMYKEAWRGKLVFSGGIPAAALRQGDQEDVTQLVNEICTQLSPGGGYIFGVSGLVDDAIVPGNFVAMAQALHQYRSQLIPELNPVPTGVPTP